MNTKTIEKLSTKEMSQIRGGEGKWIYINGEWFWMADYSLGDEDTPPPPPPPNP